MSSTIFAQSSAKGKAGIAVYRLSGVSALHILMQLTGNRISFRHKNMTYVELQDPLSGETIDRAMVAYFKAPHSYTGEDMVEFYTHGSIAIQSLLCNTILSFSLVRMAEPGEFSKRALLNNKMDVLEVDGIADLIEAETLMQHKQAISQAFGDLSAMYHTWRKNIIHVMALIEAYIDFPDEDIPNAVLTEMQYDMQNLVTEIKLHLRDNSGERLRNGITMVIYGPPNVGKSSLMNYFSRREVAIVSSIPGTTRDTIEIHLDIEGYPITLIDTAGLRVTSDEIEAKGIERAHSILDKADIKICVTDINTSHDVSYDHTKNVIHVINKVDLQDKNDYNNSEDLIHISVKNDTGLDRLYTRIVNIARDIVPNNGAPVITRARYRGNLQSTVGALNDAITMLSAFANDSTQFDNLVLIAENMRIASRCIECIVGTIDVDDILSDIFSNFCIGK